MNKIFFSVIPVLLFSLSVCAQNSTESLFSVGKTYNCLKDENAFKLLNYKLDLPDKLNDTLSRNYFSLGIGLSKFTSEETSNAVSDDMLKAIDNASNFEKLKSYAPYRFAGASYSDKDRKKTIVVTTMRAAYFSAVELNNPSALKQKTFTDSGIRYVWIEYPAQKDQSPALSWETNGVSYMIFSIAGPPVEKEEAIQYAKTVQKSAAAAIQ